MYLFYYMVNLMDGTNRFRVLIYSDHFYPSIGGSENYAIDLAKELSRLGHIVGVITPQTYESEDNFSFIVYRLKRSFLVHKSNLNFLEFPAIIKGFHPDIFHINYQTGGENLLTFLLRVMRVPIVLTYHADHVVTLGKMIDEIQMFSTFRLLKLILLQSNRDYDKMKSRGISNKKLKVLNFSGVDTYKYHCNSNKSASDGSPIRVVCISRLDDSHLYKGIDLLLETALNKRELFDRQILELNLVGEGNLRKKYEAMVIFNRIPNVNFRGDLSDEDLLKYLCASDYLILPSVNSGEGFGRVALEAISCRTPVIVSKYAGISELLQKYGSGIVYDPFSGTNVFEIITQLNSSAFERDNLVRNGQMMIANEGLTLHIAVKKTLKYYEAVVRNDLNSSQFNP